MRGLRGLCGMAALRPDGLQGGYGIVRHKHEASLSTSGPRGQAACTKNTNNTGREGLLLRSDRDDVDELLLRRSLDREQHVATGQRVQGVILGQADVIARVHAPAE